MRKVILITGASSGIGKATAQKLIGDGHIVYGAARKLEDVQAIEGIRAIQLDMTQYNTLSAAVDTIIQQEGRIDVLCNNAGYGLYGSVEETPIDSAKHQFEVNLFGLARLTQLVLPYMRKQKSGTIINTSSMGGKVYTPLGAWYHATKHALEGWSDCLRLELKQFGIHVVIIEPGSIQTKWGSIASRNMLKISGKGAYKSFANKVVSTIMRVYENPSDLSPPSVIADVVAKAINAHQPKTRYVAGRYARRLIFARKYFGDKAFDKIMLSQLK